MAYISCNVMWWSAHAKKKIQDTRQFYIMGYWISGLILVLSQPLEIGIVSPGEFHFSCLSAILFVMIHCYHFSPDLLQGFLLLLVTLIEKLIISIIYYKMEGVYVLIAVIHSLFPVIVVVVIYFIE